MSEDSLGLEYNEFVMLMYGPDILLSDTDPWSESPLVMDEVEKFPPAPPFPPWEGGCVEHSCPHASQYTGLVSSVETGRDADRIVPVIFTLACLFILLACILFFLYWSRGRKGGEERILENYLTPSSTYFSISTDTTYTNIKSFNHNPTIYQCRDSSALFSVQSYPIYEEINQSSANTEDFLTDSTEFPEYSNPTESLLTPFRSPPEASLHNLTSSLLQSSQDQSRDPRCAARRLYPLDRGKQKSAKSRLPYQ